MLARWTLTAALLAGGATAALAQAVSRYDIYGEPVDVRLDDLIQNPDAYLNRAVRTSGDLSPSIRGRGRQMALRAEFGGEAWIVPVPEIAFEFDQEALRWFGKEVQVTGVVSRGSDAETGSIVVINFWNYLGPPDKEATGPRAATSLSLEKLVSSPAKFDGKTVRVVGKFRGRNLYGDLPSRSARSRSDWVIKDDLYAIWVTGRKPKGSGWALDPTLKRDTGKWIEVVGRVQAVGGVVYLRAAELTLTTPPTPTAEVQAPPPPPEKPKVPPVVVFSLPLDGERDVPIDSKFQVQFSNDMDEKSFQGRVVLRYVGPRQPGDRPFDAARLSYDGGRKSLTVDPGDVLRPGRLLELILLPGIVDVHGLPLEARPGKMPQAAADVLRYRVTASALLIPPP